MQGTPLDGLIYGREGRDCYTWASGDLVGEFWMFVLLVSLVLDFCGFILQGNSSFLFSSGLIWFVLISLSLWMSKSEPFFFWASVSLPLKNIVICSHASNRDSSILILFWTMYITTSPSIIHPILFKLRVKEIRDTAPTSRGHLATLPEKIHQYKTVGCMLAQETYTRARAVKVNRVVSCGDVAVIQSSHTERYRYVCSCPWRCNNFYIPDR